MDGSNSRINNNEISDDKLTTKPKSTTTTTQPNNTRAFTMSRPELIIQHVWTYPKQKYTKTYNKSASQTYAARLIYSESYTSDAIIEACAHDYNDAPRIVRCLNAFYARKLFAVLESATSTERAHSWRLRALHASKRRAAGASCMPSSLAHATPI